MLAEAERLSQQFFRPQPEFAAGTVWEPPVDIYETETGWTVVVALPGVPPDRIRYRLEGDCLDIVAERAVPRECSEGVIRRKEVPHGRFARRIRFGTAPIDILDAVSRDGCLLLTVRKFDPRKR